MKKTLFQLMLGCYSLVPVFLQAKAHASPELEPLSLSAPERLVITAIGPTWLQVDWDPVAGAENYQVTTKIAATGVVVSQFSIDQTQVTINNLQTNVTYRVSVGGLRNGEAGPQSTVSGSPDLPLVFDLVLKDPAVQLNRNELICSTFCDFTGPEFQPTQQYFNCQLSWNENQTNPEPFWIEVELPEELQTEAVTSLLLHATFDPSSATGIFLTYYNPFPLEWPLEISTTMRDFLSIYPPFDSERPICTIHFLVNGITEGGTPYLKIWLAPGYNIKIKNCVFLGDIGEENGDNLASQQLPPSTYETYSNSGTPASDASKTLPYPANNHGDFRVVNPVKNELELRFEQPTGQDAILELYSMNGTLAARQQLPEGVNTFSMPAKDLVPGTYVLRVHQETGVETRLIIKQ